MREVAALVAVMGTSMLLCASGSAKTTQTITFTSTPPSPAIAGESYEVSATSSSGGPVELLISSGFAPCSFQKPDEIASVGGREGDVGPYPPLQAHQQSPQTVYLEAVGTCRIGASVAAKSELEAQTPRVPEELQEFSVAKNPAEQITFVSTPSNPIVGGTYSPLARSSANVRLGGFVSTPSVCKFPFAEDVKFLAAGTCTIDLRQDGVSAAEPPEAQQSFSVSTSLTATTPPASTGRTEPETAKAPATINTAAAAPKKLKATKLKKALQACSRGNGKRKRKRCETSARRKYGTAKTPNEHGRDAAAQPAAPFQPLRPVHWAAVLS